MQDVGEEGAKSVWDRLVRGLEDAALCPRWPATRAGRGWFRRWLAADEGDAIREAINILATAPALELAAAQAAHQGGQGKGKVFTYELRLDPEAEGFSGHGVADLPLWFQLGPEFTDQEKRFVARGFFGRDEYGAPLDGVAAALRGAVVRFCASGNPGYLDVGAGEQVPWPESRVGRMLVGSKNPSVEPAVDGVPPGLALLRQVLR